MNIEERLVADYAGTGLTVGKHPMYLPPPRIAPQQGILSAEELRALQRWRICANGRLRHRAAAARHSKRIHLHLNGR